MKYGVNTLVWTMQIGSEHEALFRRIREWGYDGAELFLSPDEPADLRWVKDVLDREGLERTTCCVIPRDAHLASRDCEVRARGRAILKKCVERTAELGAQVMCGPIYAGLGYMTGARRTEEEWQWAREALREAAGRGQELGVTLCLEPLNRFETYFLNTLEDAARLVSDIGAPNVCIHFDTFHANIEEKDPVASVRLVGKKIGHVHISETDRGVPGTGHVDWRGVLTALKSVGYNRWLTIESFAKPAPELAAAAAIWRDIAPSGDELAQRGLEFIKSVAKDVGME